MYSEGAELRMSEMLRLCVNSVAPAAVVSKEVRPRISTTMRTTPGNIRRAAAVFGVNLASADNQIAHLPGSLMHSERRAKRPDSSFPRH
jgi:hypothetical protein